MGGKGEDPRSDFDTWVDAQRAEISKFRDQLLGRRDDLEKDFNRWTDDASSSVKGPFERFKTFVDSNFSTLSEGFKNFPSNISELKERMQRERDARRDEELDVWRRWTGSEDSPDHIRMQVERAPPEDNDLVRDATHLLLRESWERNKHVPIHKILELYRDNERSFGILDQFATPILSFGGACYYKPESIENLPSTARWGWPAPKPQWLSVDWFKRSPYSPIRLEAHPYLSTANSTAPWRAAFEDLLCATLDKSMVSQERIGQRLPFGKPQSTFRGPGLDWMLSLQCRGILPPQLPSFYNDLSSSAPMGRSDKLHERVTGDLSSAIISQSVHRSLSMERDFGQLFDEIAIQAEPDTEVRQQQGVPTYSPQTAWRVPETEEELYDEMPPTTAALPPVLYGPWVPVMTGDPDDFDEADDALGVALDHGDAEIAAKCLDAYYKAYGDVDELIEEAIGVYIKNSSWPFGAEIDHALALSSIPQPYLRELQASVWKAHLETAEAERKSMEREVLRDYKKDLDMLVDCNEKRLLLARLEGAMDTTAERERQESGKDQNVQSLIDVRGSEATEKHQKPDILSQLTTTHTTRLPDGSVTTKVVLKQRFADGREETHESIYTTHEPPQPENEGAKVAGEQCPKKKGWFWL